MNDIEVLDRIESLPLSRRISGPKGYEILYGKNWPENETFKLDYEARHRMDSLAREMLEKWSDEKLHPSESALSTRHSYNRYIFCMSDGSTYAFTEQAAMTTRFRAFAAKHFGMHDFSCLGMRLMHLASIVECVHRDTRISYVKKNRFGDAGVYSRVPVGDILLDMVNASVAERGRSSRASAGPAAASRDDGYAPFSIPAEPAHKIHIPEIKVYYTLEELEQIVCDQSRTCLI